MTNQQYPVKESRRTGMLLAATAGFIDSYTFSAHDMRFASFQSGNLLQVGLNIAGGKWLHATIYFWPIFAFLLGSAFNQVLKAYTNKSLRSHTLSALIVEFFGLLLVASLELQSVSANIILPLLAFFMAIQADTFNKIHGMAYMTILSTGNLRTFSSGLTNWLIYHDEMAFRRAIRVGPVILAFFFSAILAYFAIHFLHQAALFVAPLFLLCVIILVNHEEKFQKGIDTSNNIH
ncbi:YoaK family protein [Weissella paramesenteroides]